MPYKSIEQKRAYQREWVARRRAKWFSDKTCVRCGATGDLELHHLDPEQKITHRIWSWSRERMEQEAAKCNVLCMACHLADTNAQKALRKESHPHGTRTKYRYGCRCQDCTHVQVVYMRWYNSRS